ncbi:TonB-dependent receptor [Alistipes shahii]|uniref:Outer membrane receptor proteins, mostly Fe transport n=3 Tax=Alistipes TaxID=239759 RepID=D4IKN5_9BACT|nr:carboxypeptidase-like regulatory domain-containing protein [Alistipes shahii]UWN69314.1 carboxypeptidase-like regulatory domain-containing protein [Alistipes shahii WAL 8301]CBK63497.1 Outer membrane receptor proteins, mostly Fe transport [Alistipes shahii WAL 8301]
MKKLIFIAFFISGLCSALFAQTDKATVEGVVRDSDGKPLSFATMFIAELGTGVSTDLEGKFRFTGTKGTEYTLNVSYLNHVDKEVKVKAGSPEPLVIVLEEQSYELAEVVVMADYKKNQGSTAVINQQALEHIQPTSVADVLSLIPGGLFRESSATGFNRISLRQSGSDDNTSLGMAVVMDGIPQDNDGFRASIPGLSTDEYSDRLGMNRGIDLKTLSTDHIRKIEIVKGISSAKLGNLSSGVIQTTSKIGITPAQLRMKVDPLTKLIYLGKGFRISPKMGYLHTGIDYTSVYDDRRDPMSKYSRLTGQVTYNNSVDVGDKTLFLFFKLSEVYTLNQAKEDELTQDYNESFRNKYSRTGASFKAQMYDLGKIVDNVEFIASADYTYDLIDRNRLVQTGTPLPSPLATEEGESEGIYLPSTYYSPFQIENKPLSLLTQLNAESLFETRSFRHKVIYGLSWKRTKNYGEGVMVDMTRPPYPGNNEYVRPVPNRSIPALSVGAAYAEEQLKHSNRWFDFELNAGVRFTQMFNLDTKYTELRKLQVEPRINAALSFNIDLAGGKSLRNMFRFGFGQENKLPTLDYIYPDRVYKDMIVLNAYTKQDDPFNHLITYTKIYDVTNNSLRPNRNTKYEAGWDVEYEGYSLSLTFFKEHSDRGFESVAEYSPVRYTRYVDPIDGQPIVGRRPEKEDYVADPYATFVDMDIVRNSMKVEKKGLEYLLRFPKIIPLSTTVEINGAYYDTRYSSGAPLQYHPAFRDDDRPQPYVGIYRRQDITRQRIFNTNLWFNTNIPRYKMIFTTFFQFIWLNEEMRIKGDEYPSAYFDTDGRMHTVDDRILQSIKDGHTVWRHYHIYKEDFSETLPVSLTVNFKVTKEFSRMIRASFFVNNILDINPLYKNRYNQNVRVWQKSFFGAEMTFSF